MKKKNNLVFQSLTMVTQFGINMLVPIFGCTLFGAWIGDMIHIDWLAIPFFTVGALAGMRNVYIFAHRIYASESDSQKTDYNRVYNKEENNVKKTE